MSDTSTPISGMGPAIAEGEWAGWSKWVGTEPFEDHAGPFYARLEAPGRVVCGCRIETKHMNAAGVVHGGALMTFADYSLFMIAYKQLGGLYGVTVTLTAEFLSGAAHGVRLLAKGEVVKAGRTLVFIRGLIDAEGDPILSYSGVIKIVRPRAGR